MKREVEYEILMNGPEGWEVVNTETTWKAAKTSMKEYEQNSPDYAYDIRTRMVPQPWDALEVLSGRYGAPMGRDSGDDTAKSELPEAERYLVRCSLLPFSDGCYDAGGAYWGGPANVYWVRNCDCTFEAYYRARHRGEAICMALDDYPDLRFVRGEPMYLAALEAEKANGTFDANEARRQNEREQRLAH